MPAQTGLGGVADGGQGYADLAGEVDDHFALAAGIMHARHAASGGRLRIAEEQQACGEAVEGADALHAPFLEQRLIGRVVAGDEYGRASCRERVCQEVLIPVVDVELKKKK